MKKYIKFLILSLGIFCLVGCGNNTIEKTEDSIVEEIELPDYLLDEGIIDESLFIDEKGNSVCKDKPIREVLYSLKSIAGYDILKGAHIYTSDEINDYLNISRDEYESFCFIKGNDFSEHDIVAIVRVDDEEGLNKLFDIFFEYRESLIHSEDDALSYRFMAMKIMKANDYMIMTSLGSFENLEGEAILAAYADFTNKLLDGFIHNIGKAYK